MTRVHNDTHPTGHLTTVTVERRAEEIEALAARAARGCPEALGDLYERTVDPLYRYLYARTCDVHTAEDITSETWLAVARNIVRYQHMKGHGFTAWLFTIARNKLNDHFGSRFVTKFDLTPPDGLFDVWVTSTDGGREPCPSLQVEVRDAVNRLPRKQREVVVLTDLIGLTLHETAGVLGRRPAAVRQAHKRAFDTLRGTLGADSTPKEVG